MGVATEIVRHGSIPANMDTRRQRHRTTWKHIVKDTLDPCIVLENTSLVLCNADLKCVCHEPLVEEILPK